MTFAPSRARSTQSRLPALLSREAYARLAGAGDLREFYRRINARLALGAFPEPEQSAQYEQEWGRPQGLPQEIKEVEALIQDWRRRGGDISLLTPVLGALRQELAEAQGKVAEVQSDEEIIRIASLDDYDLPEGFSSVGGGFYREGHSIWELRGAEDEEGGYLLARKREERAVDMRPQAATQAVAEPRRAMLRCASCLPAGTPALFIRNGQALPVIIIEVHDGPGGAGGEQEATVENEAGAQMPAPLDMLVTEMTVQMPPGMQMPQAQPATPAPQMPAMPAPIAPMPAPKAPIAPMPAPMAPAAPLQVTPQLLEEAATDIESGAEGAGCDCERGCACPCHNGKGKKKGPVEGMEPKLEPSSKDPDAEGTSMPGGEVSRENDGEQPEQESSPFESMSDATSAEEDDGGQEQSEPSEEETDGAIKNAFIMRSFGPEEAWGKTVTPTKKFAPQYMGGRFVFDPDQRDVYEVEGTSRAHPERDRMYGVPNPILPYPNARGGSEWALNDRVRLVPHGGGEPVFVSPMELERNFEMTENSAAPKERDEPRGRPDRQHRVEDDPHATPAWDDYRVNPDMPGESVMTPELTGTDLNQATTQDLGTSKTQVTRPQMPVRMPSSMATSPTLTAPRRVDPARTMSMKNPVRAAKRG